MWWFRIMYYVSITICFTTCVVVTFEWIKYLVSERKDKDKVSNKISEHILE